MKTELQLFNLEIPLTRELHIENGPASRRLVGILKVTRGHKFGFGEVSPLPGWSEENFKTIMPLENLQSPALSWGLQGALWNMEDKKEGKVEVSGLILKDEDKDRALYFEKNNFRSLKIKVGFDLNADLNRVPWIIEKTKTLRLRLDFNKRGTLGYLQRFLSGIDGKRVEYIEDPPGGEKALQLLNELNIMVAVDREIDKLELGKKTCIKVVKPTVTGASFPQSLADQKESFILSSSFESNLGLYQLGRGALKWKLGHLAHGLNTASYFSENIFRMQCSGCHLELPSDVEVREHLKILTENLRPLTQRTL